MKLRRSGYVEKTIEGIMESGMKFYRRKLKIDLEGGPPLNARRDSETVHRRRAKLGASECWFGRRRGGDREMEKKENDWRKEPQSKPRHRGRTQGPGGGRRPTTTQGRPSNPTVQGPERAKEQRTLTTLLVNYTVGSALKSKVQSAEDQFAKMTGGGRVRVLEKGGQVLIDLLGRNDPWASRRTCADPGCQPCQSRTWLVEKKKAARRDGKDLPACLLTRTSHQCRWQGNTYSLQCLHCALGGEEGHLLGGVQSVCQAVPG